MLCHPTPSFRIQRYISSLAESFTGQQSSFQQFLDWREPSFSTSCSLAQVCDVHPLRLPASIWLMTLIPSFRTPWGGEGGNWLWLDHSPVSSSLNFASSLSPQILIPSQLLYELPRGNVHFGVCFLGKLTWSRYNFFNICRCHRTHL